MEIKLVFCSLNGILLRKIDDDLKNIFEMEEVNIENYDRNKIIVIVEVHQADERSKVKEKTKVG